MKHRDSHMEPGPRAAWRLQQEQARLHLAGRDIERQRQKGIATAAKLKREMAELQLGRYGPPVRKGSPKRPKAKTLLTADEKQFLDHVQAGLDHVQAAQAVHKSVHPQHYGESPSKLAPKAKAPDGSWSPVKKKPGRSRTPIMDSILGPQRPLARRKRPNPYGYTDEEVAAYRRQTYGVGRRENR